MQKICLLLFIIISLNGFAQKGNNKLIAEYEDTLKVMAHTIMNAETEAEKRIANQAFIANLTEVLQYEKSFKFSFDSLPTIARIMSPDNSFRIFNWLLKKDNRTYEYLCMLRAITSEDGMTADFFKFKKYVCVSTELNSGVPTDVLYLHNPCLGLQQISCAHMIIF